MGQGSDPSLGPRRAESRGDDPGAAAQPRVHGRAGLLLHGWAYTPTVAPWSPRKGSVWCCSGHPETGRKVRDAFQEAGHPEGLGERHPWSSRRGAPALPRTLGRQGHASLLGGFCEGFRNDRQAAWCPEVAVSGCPIHPLPFPYQHAASLPSVHSFVRSLIHSFSWNNRPGSRGTGDGFFAERSGIHDIPEIIRE